MKSLPYAAALSLLCLPAFAQDTIPRFDGAYLSLGVARSISTSANSVNAATSQSSGPSLIAGYGFDLGNLIVRGELAHRRSAYSGTIVATGAPFSGTITGNSVGVKLGYPMGRMMPFIGARFGQGMDVSAVGSFDLRSSVVSLGAEYALTDTVSTTFTVERTSLNYVNSPLTVTSNSVGFGLAYRF